MSEQSPFLSLPYIQPAQAQKHVTHNEALRTLDAVVQLAVQSADLTTPPASPAPDARYIVGPSASAEWTGHDAEIALTENGAWVFIAPSAGWHADVLATGETLRFDGSNWGPQQQGPLQNIDFVGVGTTADTTNRLAVLSDATLLSHDGAGHQLKVNKNATADTASLLFQTGFSGRAEMGAMGSDDFSIKVSPDGTTFEDGLIINGQTGSVTFPNGSDSFRERLTASRSYFVRLDGNDANDGLADTAGGAFATIQHAINQLMMLDCGVHNVTINVAAGTYLETPVMSGLVQGSGTYKIVGNNAAPDTVKVRRITCQKNTFVTLEGFDFTEPSGLDLRSRAQVTLRNARFSGAGSAIAMRDAFLDCNYTTLSLASSVTTIVTMYNYANLSAFSTDFSLDANINWGGSGAFYMQSFCLAWLQSAQFSGDTASAIGKRFNLGLNSVLNTAGQGANLIPGTSAGSASTGAQYI